MTMVLGPVGAACGGIDTGATGEHGSAAEPIINGYETANPGYMVAVYSGTSPTTLWPRPCSGTLVGRDRVLTARHCLTDTGLADGTIVNFAINVTPSASPGLSKDYVWDPNQYIEVVDSPMADGRWRCDSCTIGHYDAVVLRVLNGSPLGSLRPVALSPKKPTALIGSSVRCIGYGRSVINGVPNDQEDGTTGAGTLRFAYLNVSGYSAPYLSMPNNANVQYLYHGDSGGGCFDSVIWRYLGGTEQSMAQEVGVNIFTGPSQDLSLDRIRNWVKRSVYQPGAGTYSGMYANMYLVGGETSSIPIAAIQSSGQLYTGNESAPADFIGLSNLNVRTVTGDFNGDGTMDVALVAKAGTAWATVPVLARSPYGGWSSWTNAPAGDFASWAQYTDVIAVAGDFNGDRLTDIALVPTANVGWNTIPILYSSGGGQFILPPTNMQSDLAAYSQQIPVQKKVFAGDFDGDGLSDIAVFGNPNWSTIYIGHGTGFGWFVTEAWSSDSSFAAYAADGSAKPIVGDFDGDGRTDIALLGRWAFIPVAFSNGNGTFRTTYLTNTVVTSWARTAGVKIMSGDFNGDGKDDIALTGPSGWNTLPIAVSDGVGGFTGTNWPAATFAAQAAKTRAKALSGSRWQY